MLGHRTVALLAIVGACLSAGANGAAAEPAPEEQSAAVGANSGSRERAKQLYEEGLSAYRAGKHSDAIDKLLEADRVMPNAAFSYNIALVYEGMGDQRSALRWLRSYLRQSPAGTDQTAPLTKLRKFEALLQARGLQQVSVLSNPPGATVKIDGIALVGLTPFTTELAPGSHVASLTLEGYEFVQRSFELRPDRSMDVEVALVAARPENNPTQPGVTALAGPSHEPSLARLPPATLPPVTESQSSRVKPWTWLSMGVGTALLGGALVFEVKRRSAEQDAKSASQDVYLDRYDRMESAQSTARQLAVAGSVVLAAGLGLLTYDLTRNSPTQTATLGSCPSGGLCGGLRGQF